MDEHFYNLKFSSGTGLHRNIYLQHKRYFKPTEIQRRVDEINQELRIIKKDDIMPVWINRAEIVEILTEKHDFRYVDITEVEL